MYDLEQKPRLNHVELLKIPRSELFLFQAYLTPVEPPLSRVLAAAPETSPVTVPSDTGSAGAIKT